LKTGERVCATPASRASESKKKASVDSAPWFLAQPVHVASHRGSRRCRHRRAPGPRSLRPRKPFEGAPAPPRSRSHIARGRDRPRCRRKTVACASIGCWSKIARSWPRGEKIHWNRPAGTSRYPRSEFLSASAGFFSPQFQHHTIAQAVAVEDHRVRQLWRWRRRTTSSKPVASHPSRHRQKRCVSFGGEGFADLARPARSPLKPPQVFVNADEGERPGGAARENSAATGRREPRRVAPPASESSLARPAKHTTPAPRAHVPWQSSEPTSSSQRRSKTHEIAEAPRWSGRKRD